MNTSRACLCLDAEVGFQSPRPRIALTGSRPPPCMPDRGVAASSADRAMCWRIRRGARNGPNEPSQLARYGSDHDLLQLVFRHHVTIALAQPGLRLPDRK